MPPGCASRSGVPLRRRSGSAALGSGRRDNAQVAGERYGRGLARRFAVLVLATALVGLVATPGTSSSNRVQVKTVGLAKLEPAGGSSANGRAELQLFPRHGEVEFDLRGFPQPNGEIFMVWLARAAGEANVGGAFPRTALGRFDLSTVVPGNAKVSKRHTKRAERVVVTHLPQRRARAIARQGREDGWRTAERIRGTRVVHGRVIEP
jgi:hypothetical protein